MVRAMLPAFQPGACLRRSIEFSIITTCLVANLTVLVPPSRGANAPAAPAAPARPQFELLAEQWWLVNLPERQRFDASALLMMPKGELWCLSDQRPGVFRIQFKADTNVADLVRIPEILTPAHAETLLQAKTPVAARLDCEGMARDSAGRIYISEEARRWILRWTPETRRLDRLEIDWTPVRQFFHPTDLNASFEGIAVGTDDRLYVANERHVGRIIVVDLKTLKVLDHFAVSPADSVGEDTHYTDLCWADESLWILLRDVRKLVRVDPRTKQVLVEFDYAAMETRREVAYGSFFAPGFMEGLAVDDENIWLLSDNNGVGRRQDSKDTRPTLFRCKRPDRESR